MGYFEQATTAVSEIGGVGDCELPKDEFGRDDRTKRIDAAAGALCDWVYESLLDSGEFGDGGIFNQEHLPRIQRMVAVGMMVQFEHDQEMEATLVAELLKDGKANEQTAKNIAP